MISVYIKRRLIPIFLMLIGGYSLFLTSYLLRRSSEDYFTDQIMTALFWIFTIAIASHIIISFIRVGKIRKQIEKMDTTTLEDLELEFRNSPKLGGIATMNKHLYMAGFDCSSLLPYDNISRIYLQNQRFSRFPIVSLCYFNVVNNKGKLSQVHIRKKHLKEPIKNIFKEIEKRTGPGVISDEIYQMIKLD